MKSVKPFGFLMRLLEPFWRFMTMAVQQDFVLFCGKMIAVHATFSIVHFLNDMTIWKWIIFEICAILFSVSHRVKGFMAMFAVLSFVFANPFVFTELFDENCLANRAFGIIEENTPVIAESNPETPEEKTVLVIGPLSIGLVEKPKLPETLMEQVEHISDFLRPTISPFFTFILILLTLVSFVSEGIIVELLRRSRLAAKDLAIEVTYNVLWGIGSALATFGVCFIFGISHYNLTLFYRISLYVSSSVVGIYALCYNRETLADGRKVGSWEPPLTAIMDVETMSPVMLSYLAMMGKRLPKPTDEKLANPNDDDKSQMGALWRQATSAYEDALKGAPGKVTTDNWALFKAYLEILTHVHLEDGQVAPDLDFSVVATKTMQSYVSKMTNSGKKKKGK